jgi:hypothetical protein
MRQKDKRESWINGKKPRKQRACSYSVPRRQIDLHVMRRRPSLPQAAALLMLLRIYRAAGNTSYIEERIPYLTLAKSLVPYLALEKKFFPI